MPKIENKKNENDIREGSSLLKEGLLIEKDFIIEQGKEKMELEEKQVDELLVLLEENVRLLEEKAELKKLIETLQEDFKKRENDYQRLLEDFVKEKSALLMAERRIIETKHIYLTKVLDLQKKLEIWQNSADWLKQRESNLGSAFVGYFLEWCNDFEKKCEEDFSKKIVFEEKKRVKIESNKETQTDQGVWKEFNNLEEKETFSETSSDLEKEDISIPKQIAGWALITMIVILYFFSLMAIVFNFFREKKGRVRVNRKKY